MCHTVYCTVVHDVPFLCKLPEQKSADPYRYCSEHPSVSSRINSTFTTVAPPSMAFWMSSTIIFKLISVLQYTILLSCFFHVESTVYNLVSYLSWPGWQRYTVIPSLPSEIDFMKYWSYISLLTDIPIFSIKSRTNMIAFPSLDFTYSSRGVDFIFLPSSIKVYSCRNTLFIDWA